jgi:SAM-dependent methyltransferase
MERRFGKSRDEVLSLVARRIRKIKEHGKILDVGCAGGYFLSRYFSPPDWETFGIEPSRFAAASASAKGIRILQGQAHSQNLPEEFFDVVTILDALSYFREPWKELGMIRKALKSDGLLVIEQPLGSTHMWRHSSKLGRKLCGGAMNLVDNGTFILYDASSIAHLLQRSGFCALDLVLLPPNQQSQGLRNSMFRLFYWGSQVLWTLSAHTIMLGPNFMVTATLPAKTAEADR